MKALSPRPAQRRKRGEPAAAAAAPGGPRGARSQWRHGRRRAAFEPRSRFPRRPSGAAQRNSHFVTAPAARPNRAGPAANTATATASYPLLAATRQGGTLCLTGAVASARRSAKCGLVCSDISIKWLPRQARVVCCAKPCAGRWLLSKNTPFQTSQLQLCAENGLGANLPQTIFPPKKGVLMLEKPRAGYRH